MFWDGFFDLIALKGGVCRHCGQRKSCKRNGLCLRCDEETRGTEKFRKELLGRDQPKSGAITGIDEPPKTHHILFQAVGAGLFLVPTTFFLGKYVAYGMVNQTDQTKAEVFFGGLTGLLVITFISRRLLGLVIKWTVILLLAAFVLVILLLGIYGLAASGAKH
jgi:hypothetical protein